VEAERDDGEDEPRARGTKGKSWKKVPEHMFRDPGPAVAEPDYRPRIYGNPEQLLAGAFAEMKQDYGGPLLRADSATRARF
jgi:hypothetical protein